MSSVENSTYMHIYMCMYVHMCVCSVCVYIYV
jgi:hypothetical protein